MPGDAPVRIQAALRSASGVSVVFLVLMLLAVAAYVNVGDSSVAQRSLVVVISLSSLLAVLVGVVRYRPSRRDLWYFVALAQVVGAVGAGVWYAKFAAQDAPPVSGGIQDVFFLAFYVILGAALITALRRSELGNQGVVDAAIFAAGGMLLALLILVEPSIGMSDLHVLGRTVQIASAFADVCLLAIALRLLMTAQAETPSLQLLVGATLAWIASDFVRIWLTLIGDYVPGSSAAAGWLAFFALCGAAALHPSMGALSETRDPTGAIVRWPFLAVLAMALLGSTAVTGYGLLVKKQANSAATVAITAVLSLLVATRLALLLRGEERLRHELDLRNERLLELDRMKDGFVASVSHELRTPLTSIRGFTTTMTERWDQLSDEDKLAFLQTIDSQAKRLNRLVDTVLLLSRLQAGRMSSVREPLDIARPARDAVAELGLDVRIEVSGETAAVVEADPDHIYQIFVNLLVNARRYGAPPIRIRIESDDRDVIARVSDEGEGVPVEFVPHLFDNFTQAPNAERTQGSGLGLAIVKGLVETAGGEVWYERLQPRGACFVVRLRRLTEPHGYRSPLRGAA
ncbi:MAG: HAMP domain-containing histidine kinase [Actinobacteria bacterium]|nr:MAG: HAMP domain-containing histidine kinase [Actinomycetota bacterium]